MKIKRYLVLLLIIILNNSCFRTYENGEEEEEDYSQDSDVILEVADEEHSGRMKEDLQVFDIDTKTYELNCSLPEDLYEYFKKQPKTFEYTGDLPRDWKEKFYNIFLKNKKDERFLNSIINELNRINSSMSDDEFVEVVVAYVQGAFEYDWNSYYNINEKIKYPYETIFLKKGVCADKSVLLAKMLFLLDYEVVLLAFEKANHMAVGIKVPRGYGNFGTNYAFIESTDYARIGQIPDNYAGGIKIKEAPEIIKMNIKGRKTFKKIKKIKKEDKIILEKYGREYFFASAKKKNILKNMTMIQTRLDSFKLEHKLLNCSGNGALSKKKYSKCKELTNEINRLVVIYNKQVKKYNKK